MGHRGPESGRFGATPTDCGPRPPRPQPPRNGERARWQPNRHTGDVNLRLGIRAFGLGLILFAVVTLARPWSQTVQTLIVRSPRTNGPVVRQAPLASEDLERRHTVRCLPPYIGTFADQDPSVVRGEFIHWSNCRARNERRFALGTAFIVLGVLLIVLGRPRRRW